VIDSTFASPANFRPLEIGFDMVVHSATKYLNGHSDLVAGAVVGSEAMLEKVQHLQLHFGASLDPHTCFLLERGLKTLELRIERQNANALALAEFLQQHPRVRHVCYPGLANDPGFPYASKLFSGFGGMLSFYAESPEIAETFLDHVRIPLHAASLGAVESLVVRPARSSHLGMAVEDRERLRITDDLIRVSVGIENIDELRTDFDQALG
jgi:cystathionine beta-lyase/cystathionine gamma-synthase